jgi:hypothetical protein
MTQRVTGPAVCVLFLLVTMVSTASSAVPAPQDTVRVANTVVCAPCPGEAFGLRGPGMVLWNQSGQLYFYSLDRGEAKTSGIGIGAPLVTRPQRIGTLSPFGGGDLTWAPLDGR